MPTTSGGFTAHPSRGGAISVRPVPLPGRRVLLAGAVLCSSLAACSDQGPPTASVAHRLTGATTPAGALIQLGADTARTWFATTATMAFGTVEQPTTLASLTAGAPPSRIAPPRRGPAPSAPSFRIVSGKSREGERRARIELVKGTWLSSSPQDETPPVLEIRGQTVEFVDGRGTRHDITSVPTVAAFLELLPDVDAGPLLGGLPQQLPAGAGADGTASLTHLADSIHGTVAVAGRSARVVLQSPSAVVPLTPGGSRERSLTMASLRRTPLTLSARYDLSDGGWRLATLDVRVERERSSIPATPAMGMTYSDVVVHAGPGGPGSNAGRSDEELVGEMATRLRSMPSGHRTLGTQQLAADDLCNGKQTGAYPGGAAIIMQHGLASGSCTWNAFAPRVTSTFQVRSTEQWSTSNLSSIEIQASELIGDLVASGTTNATLIGHSMGSLVARRVGRLAPSRLAGVVSLDTPHRGAYLAWYSPAGILSLIGTWVGIDLIQRCSDSPGSSDWLDWLGCTAYAAIVEPVLQSGVGQVVGTYAGAINDLAEDSYVIASLNNTGYESFQRSAVQNSIPTDLSLFRLAADVTNTPWDPVAFVGSYWFLDFLAASFMFSGNWYIAIPLYAITTTITLADIVWNLASGAWMGEGPGDGIVAQLSQEWPTWAPGAYTPQNQYRNADVSLWAPPTADSHLGNTKGDNTWARTHQALLDQGVLEIP